MTIELTETSYVAAVWFIGGTTPWGEGWDYLCALYKGNAAERTWTIRGRLRQHTGSGPDPFTDGDPKTWYGATVEGEEHEVCEKHERVMREVAESLRADRFERVDVRGNAKAFAAAMHRRPWAHVREAQ